MLYRSLAAISAATLLLSLAGSSAPSAAAESPSPAAGGGAHAVYNGRVINLSKGWEGAKVCVVHAKSNVRCYDSAAAYDAARGARADAKPEGSRFNCPRGWFCLWADINYNGRRLQFRDRGFCQNLTDYNFNDVASSYSNRTSRYVSIYRNVSCRTNIRTSRPHGFDANLISNPSGGGSLNDQASSIAIF
jgi:hypothetical protein